MTKLGLREGFGPEPRTPSDERGTAVLDRAKQVFRFLKAFAERNIPLRRTLAEQLWSMSLRSLPRHPAITVSEVCVAKPGKAVVDADSQVEDPGPSPATHPHTSTSPTAGHTGLPAARMGAA